MAPAEGALIGRIVSAVLAPASPVSRSHFMSPADPEVGPEFAAAWGSSLPQLGRKHLNSMGETSHGV